LTDEPPGIITELLFPFVSLHFSYHTPSVWFEAVIW